MQSVVRCHVKDKELCTHAAFLEVTDEHVRKECAGFVRVSDVFKGLRRILACATAVRWEQPGLREQATYHPQQGLPRHLLGARITVRCFNGTTKGYKWYTHLVYELCDIVD
jgi:hypothetical protein